jgi:predicted small secreted protein
VNRDSRIDHHLLRGVVNTDHGAAPTVVAAEARFFELTEAAMKTFQSNTKARTLPLLSVLVPFFVGAIVILQSGCNTTEGAGKDIKAAGEGIENAAAKAKN